MEWPTEGNYDNQTWFFNQTENNQIYHKITFL